MPNLTYIKHPTITMLPILILILMLWLAPLANAQTRDLLPTPPNGGPGSAVIEADMALPYTQKTATQTYEILRKSTDSNPKADIPAGGDDILINTDESYTDSDLAIAENGDIYVAVSVGIETSNTEIQVFRSQNGGDSFGLWGTMTDPSSSIYFRNPSVVVGEGVDNKFYMVFKYGEPGIYSQIRMVSADLADVSANFSAPVIAMAADGTSFEKPDIATDSDSWSGFYIYVTAVGNDYVGPDIWYARSTNQGATFEDAYEIASLAYDDRSYRNPDISYGYGGVVHVVWSFGLDDNSIDRSLRYRRIANYGGGGLANWGPNLSPTPHYNDMWELYPHIEASQTTNELLIAYWRGSYMEGGWLDSQGYGVVPSLDGGLTLGSEAFNEDEFCIPQDLAFQSSTGDFILAIERTGEFGLQKINLADLPVWDDFEVLSDVPYHSSTFPACGLDLDESHGQRAAFAWIQGGPLVDPNNLFMDAEWRADPGYPNLAPGFPVDLAVGAKSDPGVADLDGDGDLEIFFGDINGYIQIFHHDGTPVDGWPVFVGYLSKSPIAVGDLVGYGEQVVVAGDIMGSLHAFDQYGESLDGFPYQVNTSGSVFFCLGAMGDRFARTIVAAAGTKLHFINPQGEKVPGSISYDTYSHIIDVPPAVGDLNGDGVNEVVWAFDTYVIATNMMTTGTVLYRSCPHHICSAPTLADADLDGDMEIAAPLFNGQLVVMDGDGSYLPGFPVASSSGSQLSSVSWAQLLGTWEPELAFSAEDYTVELFYTDGTRALNWPQSSTIYRWLFGSPIIGLVEGSSSDIIVGDMGQQAWAWDNAGNEIPGWPKAAGAEVEVSAAMGDLDLDGSGEVILVSDDQLFVFDVNSPVADINRTWPMQGHNPARTGCLNCPEDITTSVPDDQDSADRQPAVTQISFASPSPNPASSSTVFSFALPVSSQVRLEVFDIRGHRVRTVVKAEVGAGHHALAWDCRDGQGRKLPSGTYFGRLRARGPGVDQVISRKINLIR